ncbi:MAG: tRNA (pseudouridine(54)-N(1))-methyltransferase TrmY [Candidatus Thermoplasmatota archaeon]
MREFILYSRKGRTAGDFTSLRSAGRLDTVYQCILSALFLSHGIRRDVVFHAVLEGPPDPPLHLSVKGSELRDARVDEQTWTHLLRKVLPQATKSPRTKPYNQKHRRALGGGAHPGITVCRGSLQSLVRASSQSGAQIFVLEEKGAELREVKFGEHTTFILGDHIGLPRKEERYALRYGTKLSLGKKRYLAMSCINILNYEMDCLAPS